MLNRAVDRGQLFFDEDDYQDFESLIFSTKAKSPMRVCSFCLMPNHWHLLLWPEQDGQLSTFMKRLTSTHAQRWLKKWDLRSTGHVYQGRFKSFPVETERYALSVFRYVEQNPLRAGLVCSAEEWRWSSLWHRLNPGEEESVVLSNWPLEIPTNWLHIVNTTEQSKVELERLRTCVNRGQPYGSDEWVRKEIRELHLNSTIVPIGRPSSDNNTRVASVEKP